MILIVVTVSGRLGPISSRRVGSASPRRRTLLSRAPPRRAMFSRYFRRSSVHVEVTIVRRLARSGPQGARHTVHNARLRSRRAACAIRHCPRVANSNEQARARSEIWHTTSALCHRPRRAEGDVPRIYPIDASRPGARAQLEQLYTCVARIGAPDPRRSRYMDTRMTCY
jgi:hypothetical protein